VRVVKGIKAPPEEEEVIRLLSPGGEAVPAGRERIEPLVRASIEEANELVDPAAVYDFVDSPELLEDRVFGSAELIALCVCTIGPRLEERVKELMERGEWARGTVLDAVGSEMTEALARLLDDRIAAEGAAEHRQPGARFSPGYGEWDLHGQRIFFARLEPGRIGLRLSESMMMIPRKSVSFALNFGSDPEPPRCVTPCEQCMMEDCRFRR
jgi:hypothetical protein